MDCRATMKRWQKAAAAAGLVGFIMTAAACGSLRLGSPVFVSAEDWAVDGGSPARTHAMIDAALAPPLEEAWRYNAVAGFGPASPLVIDSVVFVSTLKGEVHAISLFKGRKLGAKKVGSAVTGSPAFMENTLFTPNAWGRTVLQAHDVRQGRVLWSLRGVPIENGVLAEDRMLYVANIEAGVAALNRLTGEIVWERSGDPRRTFHASPVADAEWIYVIDDRGQVSALDKKNGELRWSRSLDTMVGRTPAYHAGRLYVPTEEGMLLALDAKTGETLWRYAAQNPLVKLTSPSVSDVGLILGGTDGLVRALSPADGRPLWTYQAEASVTAPPLLAGETVYIGTHDKMLIALDSADGTEVWKTELKGRIRSAFALARGHLIVLAEPRFVYAFRPAIATPDETPKTNAP